VRSELPNATPQPPRPHIQWCAAVRWSGSSARARSPGVDVGSGDVAVVSPVPAQMWQGAKSRRRCGSGARGARLPVGTCPLTQLRPLEICRNAFGLSTGFQVRGLHADRTRVVCTASCGRGVARRVKRCLREYRRSCRDIVVMQSPTSPHGEGETSGQRRECGSSGVRVAPRGRRRVGGGIGTRCRDEVV